MLDALGDHFQVQAVREGDDRLDDYGVVLVA